MNSPDIVFEEARQIREMQEKKLQELLRYLAGNSPFYRERFAAYGINPFAIQTLRDLQTLPVTTKEELQRRNWDFCSVPREKIAEYMASSGTLGAPVTIALTENDLDRLAYNELCSFRLAGGTAADTYQLMLTLDRQFMAGIAYYLGIRKLGASLVRVGPGAPFLQWATIERVNPTVIVAVPSFLVKLIEYAEANAINLNASSVKAAICIGETIRHPDNRPNRLAERIQNAWNIKLFGTYASTEMQTAFTECTASAGGHLNPELLIVEVLDENNQPVPAGQPGEVTITTLGVEGMPLLRYKTGDICILQTEPCSCGRSSARLSGVIGRRQQMIKFKGTTLYPPAIYDLLNEMPAIRDYVVELRSSEWDTDEVRIHLDIPEPSESLLTTIREKLRSGLRVIPEVLLTSAAELQALQFPEGGRKPQKLIDRR
ncbi:AMP-binding protein [Flavihumibacter sp. CACIAM 22H1]|uniref:phenylacetate--CoA ligase family protein n=1 Tax=Flavihumibacter sp. CACIAM 22H1 TaxID=1812911 RepID=UPI0007A7EAD9|nr:AMP-binding protein [Flavihumibacter sp. CACIAM 22H1]KYP14593.1 MAG: phenylacetate--CoA ligase [Flavihumibacter sp. CACIAM 22H1]